MVTADFSPEIMDARRQTKLFKITETKKKINPQL